jgi:3-hydroxymyristoyl/3-hydroxydecanoyl-(acyl carrier protein) dehydratase
MNTLPLSIPADHPAYAGHFPGRPILPGVVLLDRAQRALEQAAGLRITGLAMAKFLSPALPGEALELDYEASATGLRFEIRCGERRVASGRYTVVNT